MTLEQAIAALARHRDDIDAVDLRILALLNERTRIVERIGDIKEAVHMPIYEPKREDEVYRNVLTNNQGPLPPESVKRIFERLIDEMRTLQKIRMEQKRAQESGTR